MSVKVAIRVRPFNQRQIALNSKCCVQMIDKKTKLTTSQGQKQYAKREFSFDYSIWSHDGFQILQNGLMVATNDRYWDQTRVFNQIGTQIINNAWLGYNCCLFAYGQTGSGKSYSMLGYGLNKGIVPLSCQQIFSRIPQLSQNNKTYSVTVSMLEIYNEKVQDLLIAASKRPKGGLQIRQNKAIGVYVQGITKHRVNSFKQIQKWMDQGSKNRSLASTQMNQYSSRAHTIISIEFIQRQQLTKNQITQKSSTIHLIDLAGSQRVGKTGLSNTDRLKQAGNINKSLHHLGLVIQILAQKSQGKRTKQIVPYRSSVLTRILQNSLGGNSKTIMICAISPSNDNYQQSLSTLKYADQVKKIKNNATVNQSLTDKIIRELKEQNIRLKNLIKQFNDRSTLSSGQFGNLQQAKQYQKLIQKNLYRTSTAVKQFGVSSGEDYLTNISGIDQQDSRIDLSTDQSFLDSEMFKLDQPYITNLNQDQMLTGKIKYSIDPQIIIGRKQGIPTPNVILGAIGIQKLHARIFQRQSSVFITTYNQNASQRTYVNGDNFQNEMELFHNDRIIFGTSCVFIVKTPSQIMRAVINEQLNYQFAISQLQSIDKNKSVVQQDVLIKLKTMQQEILKQKKKMQQKIKQERLLYEEQIKLMKNQKQNQMNNILSKLKKKQQQSKILQDSYRQMQEIKNKTKKLQQNLQNQRKKKSQLQSKLIQSAKLEVQFKNSKVKQEQRLKQQKMLKEQIKRILAQKELIEQNQRKIRKQKEEKQKQKQEYQNKMKEIQQIKQKQKQQQKIQKILEKKMEICQNLNILQQRYSQLKKNKKQIQQLRNHFIKKQKVDLQKKLVDILPLITQMNLITKQMNRNIQFQAKIDYQYFGIHQMTQCLKNSWYKSKIKIKIQIENLEQDRIYFWNIQRFKNRFDLAKDRLQKFYQNPRNPIFVQRQMDPFWDPPEAQLIGQAYLTLQHLMYNLDYYNPSLKIIGNMTSKGEISVRIYPTNEQGTQNLAKKQQKDDLIFFPRTLLQKDLYFIVKIDKLKLNQSAIQSYIEYEILQNSYKFNKFQTPKILKKQLGKQIYYYQKHALKEISQGSLFYLSKSHICFKIYATKKNHQLKNASSTFAFSATKLNKKQQNDEINQYFVDGFEDDKISLKSQTLNRNQYNQSMKIQPKGDYYQNKQVVQKIYKKYSEKQEKKNQKLTSLNQLKKSQSQNNKYNEKTNSSKHSTHQQNQPSKQSSAVPTNGHLKNNNDIPGNKKDEKCLIF